MKLTVGQRILSKARPHITWLEPGVYDVVRFCGPRKVIIDITTPTSLQRQLTIVSLGKGNYLNDSQKNKHADRRPA